MKQRPLSPLSRALTAPRPQIVAPRLGTPPKRGIAPPPFIRIDAENERAKTRESTKRADYEGGWNRVIVPDTASTRVMSTTRRWRGVDVFIARPNFVVPAFSLIRAKIYAVIEGMDRVLVASGIYRYSVFEEAPSTWLCGARVACDRFDVELSHNVTPGDPGVDAVDIGVIASDELVELPAMLGAVSLVDTPRITDQTSKAPTPIPGEPGYELAMVHATAGVAGRWLHIHDQDDDDPIFLTGIAPVFSFGFPSIGSSITDVSAALRAIRFTTGIVAIASSTPATTTPAVGDVAYQVFFR